MEGAKHGCFERANASSVLSLPAAGLMRAVVAAFFQPGLALAGRRRREDTDQVRGYSARFTSHCCRHQNPHVWERQGNTKAIARGIKKREREILTSLKHYMGFNSSTLINI
ncbi:unnamed protein product [Lepidochelys kempii]